MRRGWTTTASCSRTWPPPTGRSQHSRKYLLSIQKNICRLDLDLYYDPLEPRDLGGDRGAKLGIISAQKCNLCLGDLARSLLIITNVFSFFKILFPFQIPRAGERWHQLQLRARPAVLQQGQPPRNEERQTLQHARHPLQGEGHCHIIVKIIIYYHYHSFM